MRRVSGLRASRGRKRPPRWHPTPGQPSAERKALWNRLLAVVGALTGEPDDTDAAVAVWAFLHGYAALGASGLYGASGPCGGLTRGIHALARGLAPARGGATAGD